VMRAFSFQSYGYQAGLSIAKSIFGVSSFDNPVKSLAQKVNVIFKCLFSFFYPHAQKN
jgi:hypothetical protein